MTVAFPHPDPLPASKERKIAPPTPLGLLAELTRRCPLGCPYCSNPLQLDRREAELDIATWARVFREAAGLGVLQVHLSGGEPGARREIDFGGCRCQALALTGDARATDPVCHLSPHHAKIEALAVAREEAPYIYRRM